MKNQFYFLILLNAIQIYSSFLDKIPSKFISDQNFIDMTLKSQKKSVVLYAAPKGSKNTCNINYPCSLETAIKKLKAGYTLYLKEGTYNVKEGITISAKGKADSYITISSAPNEKAIISSECNKKSKKDECEEISLFLLDEDASYIIIENLISTTKNNTKGYEASGILLMGENSGIDNVMIFKNSVKNNNLGFSEAISIEGNCRYIYVLNNSLTNNNNIGIDLMEILEHVKMKNQISLKNQWQCIILLINLIVDMMNRQVFMLMGQRRFIFLKIQYLIHNMELK